uniref:Hexosyltransferase n=1 Tax=Caligus clemensi TaxID=344056 RepID=C1C006_CALCM|nr:Beta-1,3-galactosyltransferase 1 [Caligus clemensi]
MFEKRRCRMNVILVVLVVLCIVGYIFKLNSLTPSYYKVIRNVKLFELRSGISEDEHDDLLWLPSDNFNASHYIHSDNNSMIHEPKLQKDAFALSYPKTQILIVCHSAPSNFVRRDTIRETWGAKLDALPMSLVFLIGKTRDMEVQKKIDFESLMYKDILQEDFLDSYRTLSIKSVFMLKYLNYLVDDLRFPVRFVLKLDDDSYLNPLALFKFTSVASIHPMTIFGKALGPGSPVHRPGEIDEAKWTVPKYVYKEDIFPNAASGSGYLFDVEAGMCLYRKSLEVPLINLEDIFLTGLLRHKCGIHLRNNSKFHFLGLNVCQIRKTDILIHRVKKPAHMYLIHEILNGVSKCEAKEKGFQEDNISDATADADEKSDVLMSFKI